MNTIMIKQLIAKDWHFNRVPMLFYTFIGLIALGLLQVKPQGLFYPAMVLLISALVIVGAHLIFVTVVNERKEQTLTFIMSLPISYMDYTSAKLMMNIGTFMTIWLLLTLGMIGTIVSVDSLSNGLIPYMTIALTELFAAYVLVLAVAFITESEVWTIVIMSITNVGVSLFWYFLGTFDSIAQYIEGDIAVWNSTAVSFVLVEVALIVLLIGVTLFFQSKKTDFL